MSNEFRPDEAFALKMDAADPLASFRDRFYIPHGIIYMDGNSLGLMSIDAETSVRRVMEEWKSLAIGGWLEGKPGWFYLSEDLGAKAAPLVGAEPDEVVCTASTTVNIHALMSTFYQPEGKRKKILADELTFPTDIYALQGQIKLKNLDPGSELILVPGEAGRTLDEETIIKHMSDEIAVILLPSVLYRSGQLLDMERLTQEAHRRHILIGFDCSHSVGAIPHEFSKWGVDFAMWCGYKYMNGGPGAPAFIYINKNHFEKEPLLSGWFGYKKDKQFDLVLDFDHAPSAGGWQISTPSILSAAAVEGALNITLEAGIERIREKSLLLTEYLIALKNHLLPQDRYPITIGTPLEEERRGGHVALEGGDNLWQIHQALKARGIIPDFRPPGIIRLAPIPLYNTFHDIWNAVHAIKQIIDTHEYQSFPIQRSAVT